VIYPSNVDALREAQKALRKIEWQSGDSAFNNAVDAALDTIAYALSIVEMARIKAAGES
jgi:hypothetical protein